jgi:hypothetical protein
VGGLVLAFRIQAELLQMSNLNRGTELRNTVVDIVLSPLGRTPRSRIGRRIYRNLQASLSPLLWRPLIFASVAFAAGLADMTQKAIHAPRFYDSHATQALPGYCTHGANPIVCAPLVTNLVAVALPIVLLGLASIFASVLAFAAMFARGHFISNISHFLWWLAGSNVATIALIVGGLALLNGAGLAIAHGVDVVRQQGTEGLAAWHSWLGLDSPTRLHPLYPGLLSLVLMGGVFLYIVVLPLLRPRLRPRRARAR